MCFSIIEEKQKPWKNEVVYKVVNKRGYSLYMLEDGSRACYRPLETVKAEGGCFTARLTVSFDDKPPKRSLVACAGIYVYKKYEDALNQARKYSPRGIRKVVVLEVDPKDFLYHDQDDKIATYKKVKVIGDILV